MDVSDELEAWTAEHVRLVGPFELALERPWARVWRVATTAGAAWLKECASVQAFEPPLTAVLAERWPDRLPEVLAYDVPRRRLLLADAGARLGVGGDAQPWLDVLPRYAELQRGEAVHVTEHLAAGVPDRRLERFPNLYEGILERDLPLGEADLQRLRSFRGRFAEMCAELGAAGIAETMQHDDLHGNNVYRRGDVLRILDWGDACVSHPFLTFRVTFVHLFLRSTDPWRDRLRDAYLETWGNPADLRVPFELAQRLAPFAHLFVLLRVLDATGPSGRGYLTDLAETLAECVDAAT